MRRKLLLLGLTWLGLLAAAPAASAVNLRYWGGPVVHSTNVQMVEWGSGVRSTYTDPNTGDPAFFKYLASQSGTTTDIGGVLAQYIDNSGANSQNTLSYAGLHEISPPTSGAVGGCSLPSCVDDSVLQSALHDAITANALPAPTGDGLQTIYVVLFPPGTDVCQGGGCAYDKTGGFCAYHGSFPLDSSTHILYAAMVDDGPGSINDGGCGSSTNDVDNQTGLVSHEVAETINDPLVAEASVNGPPMGWYDARLGEIADICVGTNEQALNGAWTVQKIWSNRDGQCVAGESAYSAPTAAFLADNTAATGQRVSFDASASSDPSGNTASIARTSYSIGSGLASYRWDWGDGNTSPPSSSAGATHAYENPGNYEVSLTVTDNLGFTSTVTHQIAVTGSPAPPAVTTGSASGVGSQQATLNGTINPENQSVQYRFRYGTSPSALDQSTPLTSGPTGATPTPVSSTISSLSPSTTYYYELELDSGAQTYTGSVMSFTTGAASAPPAPTPPPQPTPGGNTTPGAASQPPAPAPPPSVSTGSASDITSAGATVAGSVNPNGAATTYQVQFGLSSSYGFSSAVQSAGAGTASLPVRVSLTGLKPGTTYHYRFVASNSGATAVGGDGTFTTARALAAAPRFSFRVLGHPSLAPSLRSGFKVRFTCSRSCVARFSVLALPGGGVLRAGSFPLSVAAGTSRLRAKGSGTAVLRFTRKQSARLRQARLLHLSVTGVAAGSGTATSSPVLRSLSLRRLS